MSNVTNWRNYRNLYFKIIVLLGFCKEVIKVCLKKIKIVFIDDNEPNNVLTQAVIDAEEMHIEGFYAQSIEQAIGMLEQFEEEKNFPKFIFSDIKLPIKDGYYFAKYYFEHFYENNKEVKMFFMSADFQQEQSDELTKYPFVFDVFIKPFRIEIYDAEIKDELDRLNAADTNN